LAARDQVNVEVRDGLARGRPDVDADVEAVRWIVAFGAGGEVGCGLTQRLPNRGYFVWSGVEEVGDVSARADQGVTRGDRERIADGQRQGRLRNDQPGVGVTEGTVFGGQRLLFLEVGGCRRSDSSRVGTPSGP
jgi:hypothetical protein